jgi:uncharacterized protein YyaL (SSP411 family)
MGERLLSETSPYLLQHATNPVDWYPWGEEAFEKARKEGKPIFLSIGYASCHWCHVMAHEVFEDETVGSALNASFVSIKVDREERPDVDEAYMAALQLSGGRGGWPLSAWLTPDRKPFFLGTYFPRDDQGQHPGFLTIVQSVSRAWQSRRKDLVETAEQYGKALEQALGRPAPGSFTPLDMRLCDSGVRTLLADFDPNNGGFGAAPKFPPHSALQFLLAYVASPKADPELRQAAFSAALTSVIAMACGGIHDHVGGGFHRYSTDAEWVLPHFEKMLYDNALMLGNMAMSAAYLQQLRPELAPLLGQTLEGLLAFLLRDLQNEDGLYGSAMDADSEGEEGKFYTWSIAQLEEVLGSKAEAFAKAYEARKEGNFHDEATGTLTGQNVLHFGPEPSLEFGEELNLLLEARMKRVAPSKDAKAVIGWNGLLISGLATCGAVALAVDLAEKVLAHRDETGGLPRTVVDGKPHGHGFLEDYAAVCLGLFDLAEVWSAAPPTAENAPAQAERWKTEAISVLSALRARFEDVERGGFFATETHHEELFGRTKPVVDTPIPSGNGMALQCMIRAGFVEEARKAATSFIGWMERAPGSTEALLVAVLELADPAPVEEAAPVADPSEISVKLSGRELVAGSDGWASGTVTLFVPEGLHLNSSDPIARWLSPTRLEFQGIESVVEYPEAVNEGYDGTVEIPFRLKLPTGKSSAEFELKVRYQPCTNTECLVAAEKVFDGVVLAG